MLRITRHKNSFRVAFEGSDKNPIVNFFDVSQQWQYLFAHCDSNTTHSSIVGDLVCRYREQDTVANIMAYEIRITVLVKKAMFLDAACLKVVLVDVEVEFT